MFFPNQGRHLADSDLERFGSRLVLSLFVPHADVLQGLAGVIWRWGPGAVSLQPSFSITASSL